MNSTNHTKSKMQCRIVWQHKQDAALKDHGQWHPISRLENAEAWVKKMNKDWPAINHWVEKSNDV